MPSVVVSAGAMVPPTTPFEPSLLMNTEKPADAPRPATATSRVISVRTSMNSLLSAVRSTALLAEADCVASVASRSSSVEMLLSAPSFDLQGGQRVVRVADALVQYGLGRAVRVGQREARGVVAGVVDAVATRQPRNGLLQAHRWSLMRFACAPAAEMLETTEKDAIGELLRECGSRRPCRPTVRPSVASRTTQQPGAIWGAHCKAQGNLDEAVAAYREALRLNPDYAMAHYNLGNALRAPGPPGRGDRGVAPPCG